MLEINFEDCNDCPYLNMTEIDQILNLHYNEPHICYKYHKRVFHHSNSIPYHTPKLWPCGECLEERNKNE